MSRDTFSLPRCHFYGPLDGSEEEEWVSMPDPLPSSPFEYLPAEHHPTEEETRLAEQYVRGDFSGGYLTSQIAHFRMPNEKSSHERRRKRFQALLDLTEQNDLELPPSLIQLGQNDEYNDRLRHNTIWFNPVPALTPLLKHGTWFLAELFYEGQGCGYWSVLLAPNETHRMIYCEESLGNDGEYPNGFAPDIESLQFYQCADSFDEWLTHYFLDCTESDRRYDDMLARYPGM